MDDTGSPVRWARVFFTTRAWACTPFPCASACARAEDGLTSSCSDLRDSGERAMAEVDLDRIKRAWRDAGDAEVARALSAREDYLPGAYEIILVEARRRNVRADDHVGPEEVPLFRVGRRVVAAVHSHPLVSGLLAGVILRLAVMPAPRWLPLLQSFHWAIWPAIYIVLCCGVLCLICWPLRRFRPVVLAAVGACIGNAAVSIVLTLFYPQVFQGAGWLQVAVTFTLILLMLWGIPCLLVCAIVRLRNSLWPVYEPGHCMNCGYNLRGLPKPRCPECGQPFDRAEDEVDAEPAVEEPSPHHERAS